MFYGGGCRWHIPGMGLSSKAKGHIYSNLEKYARSGMGMEKACDSLLRQPRVSGSERRIYEGLLRGVKEGRTIGDSLRHAGGMVSPLEAEVVSAAESGGMLEKGFSHLAEYFRRIDKTRRRIRKGMTYPIVLAHLAIPICIFAASAVSSFSLDGSVPAFSLDRALADIGKALLGFWAILLILWFVGKVLHAMSLRSASIDSLLMGFPLIGSVRRAVAMERFTKVFEIFLLAGRKMSDSMRGAGKASGSGMLTEATEVGAQMIEEGDRVAAVLFSAPRSFPNDFARGMAAAEESGQMDTELSQWGEFYADRARETTETVAEWTPKLFYWGILIFVGYLVVQFGTAYSDLISRLVG